MAILLDSHALLWWLLGNPRLSRSARLAIATDPDVLVSAVCAVKLATKVRIGKLPEAARIVHRLAEVIAEQGFRTLPISLEHGRISGLLPGAYRDPFDSMIAAPSLLDDIPVVTNDPGVMGFGVAVVW